MLAIVAAPTLLYFAVRHNIDASPPSPVLFDAHLRALSPRSSSWLRPFVTRWLVVPLVAGIALAMALAFSQQLAPTRKFLVLVADFDYFYPSRHFGLTQRIVERLREAVVGDSDIDVQALGKPIPWEQGSVGARAEGMTKGAAIIIWGDYKVPKDKALFAVHFEMLRIPPPSTMPANPANIVPPSLFREGVVSIADLESFTIQERLSGQLVYLTLMVSGLARSVAGEWRQAIDRYSQALLAPEAKEMIGSEVVYFYRGTAYGMLGRDTEADADLSRSIDINPNLGVAFDNRGFVRLKHNAKSAMSDFTRAIELNPCDDKALVNRGVLRRHSGDISGAISDYDAAIRCSPRNYLPLVVRGVAFRVTGKLPEAIEDYSKALELNPDSFEALNDRGDAFYAQGNFDEAIADYTGAIRINSRLAESYLNRGNAWCAKHEIQKGLEDYSRAIGLKPAWALAFVSRGSAYAIVGQIDRAIADYSRAVELDSGLIEAYRHRALLFLLKREYQGALADLSHLCSAELQAADRQFACEQRNYLSALLARSQK
jgi:tetratricopeptide (TPR) repeat protein